MTLSQKLPKNVGDLGKLIVAKGFDPLFSGVERTKSAKSLRRSAISSKKCKQPKTCVPEFSCAECSEPETVGGFLKGGQTA